MSNIFFVLRRREKICKVFLCPLALVMLFIYVTLTFFPQNLTVTSVNAVVNSDIYTLTVATNQSINLQIAPTPIETISVAKDTIIANTSSPTGYKLYVSTGSNSNEIKLDTQNNQGDQTSKFMPTTGTQFQPTTLENNTWGYAVAGLNGFDESYKTTSPSTSSKFAAIPTLGNEVLVKEHNGIATNEQTEIYYAAKADMNMLAGNYTTTIMYTATADTPSEISDSATFIPTELEEDYEEQQATINIDLSTNRELGEMSVIIGENTCNNVQTLQTNPLSLSCTLPKEITVGKYNVFIIIPRLGKTYTITDGLTIKAKEPDNPGSEDDDNQRTQACDSVAKMQDIDIIANSLRIEEQVQLCDARDNKIYWVAKLKDGNIWMTQNLDYDIKADTNQVANIDGTETTWVSNSTYAPQATANTMNFRSDDISTTSINSYDPGDYYIPNGAGLESDYLSNINQKVAIVSLMGADIIGDTNAHYHLGNYYNYNAATAGTGGDIAEEKDAPSSICPKGWRLPVGNSHTMNYSFGRLANTYGITDSVELLIHPLFFVYSGYIYRGGLDSQGHHGNYWSSRIADSLSAYVLEAGVNNVNPLSNYSKWSGNNIRCVAVNTTADIRIPVTVNFTGDGIEQILFEAQNHETKIATTSNNIVELEKDIQYTVTMRTNAEHKFESWEAPDGTLSSITDNPTLLTANLPVTITAKSEEFCSGIMYNGTCVNKMQDLTVKICNAMELERQYQFMDTRDNKYYWIAKLRDNNCWMTQNLDYDINPDTNIIADVYDIEGTWTSSSVYAPQATSTVEIENSNEDGTYSYDPGDYYMPLDKDMTNGLESISSLADTNIIDNVNAHYHLGNYYQWNAATAGTGSAVYGQNASASICPKGWRLPMNSEKSYSFKAIEEKYNIHDNWAVKHTPIGDVMSRAPLYFIDNDSDIKPSIDYWTSTTYSSSRAYVLHYEMSGFDPAASNARYNMANVRCVFSDSALYHITKMQEMTPAITADTAMYASKQLKDTRDGKYYWVTKLEDGNIWMTQNLDYDITTGTNSVTTRGGSETTWSAPRDTQTSIFKNGKAVETYSYDPGDYYLPGGTSTSMYSSNAPYSSSIGDENMHYHIGNYYQWNAATAGTGGTITSSEASASICPKGWRLPTGSNSTSYSFGALINASGANKVSKLTVAPYYFVSAGYVYSTGTVRSIGTIGYYWSSRAYSSKTNAYVMQLNTSAVYPNENSTRSRGYSVRCVAV